MFYFVLLSSGSTRLESPTTAPTSRAGRRRPGSARWQACSTRRCRRCSGRRCNCARRAAPTPACTPPARWPTSTSRPRRSRTRTAHAASEGPGVPARWCDGWPGCLPEDVRVRDVSQGAERFRRPVLGAAQALRIPAVDRASTASSRRRPGSSRRGRVRSTSTRWRPRRGNCWGCTTSPRSAGHREGATTIRDLQRLEWVARRRRDHRLRHRRRVLLVDGAVAGRRAAGGGGGPPRTRLVRRAVDVDAAVQRFRRRARPAA